MDSATKTITTARKTPMEMTDEEYRAYCTRYLEHGGWKRETAGKDWDRGLDAIVKVGRVVEPRKRGILVTGPYGCGKTAFVKAIHRVSQIPFRVLRLANRQTLDILDCESDSFDREDYEKLFRSRVLLDDLGAECLTNNYGVRLDLVGDFITEYHYRGGERLYITTNLTSEKIIERYGGRVADRLKDLCVPVTFKGASKRTWSK